MSLPATAASFVIDSFSDGYFFMQGHSPGSTGDKDIQYGSGMIGGDRYTKIGSTAALDEMGAFAAVAPGTSFLEFECGTSILGEEVELFILYSPVIEIAPDMDLSRFTGFELVVPHVTGVGQVEVTIRNASTGGGTEEFVAPISQNGTLFIPMDSESVDPAVVTHVHQIFLTISGASSDFSLSVDEFRIVPEPATGIFMMVSALLGLTARRTANKPQQDNSR